MQSETALFTMLQTLLIPFSLAGGRGGWRQGMGVNVPDTSREQCCCMSDAASEGSREQQHLETLACL